MENLSPVTQLEARQFIIELANLPSFQRKDAKERAAWSRFARKFAHWLKCLGPEGWSASQAAGTGSSAFAVGAALSSAWFGNPYAGATITLSQLLRRAWSGPTRQEREIGILAVVADVAHVYGIRKGHPIAIAEQRIGWALLQAVHDADLMRVCLNPDCPARYFVADRRSQKFCSEKCAEPARREYKRRWWNDNRGSGARK